MLTMLCASSTVGRNIVEAFRLVEPDRVEMSGSAASLVSDSRNKVRQVAASSASKSSSENSSSSDICVGTRRGKPL